MNTELKELERKWWKSVLSHHILRKTRNKLHNQIIRCPDLDSKRLSCELKSGVFSSGLPGICWEGTWIRLRVLLLKSYPSYRSPLAPIDVMYSEVMTASQNRHKSELGFFAMVNCKKKTTRFIFSKRTYRVSLVS